MRAPPSTLIPLVIGILPLLVFHLTHLVSARAGLVPWCVPYWDSCTSISATGREGAGFVLFKVTMIPAAGLLYMYWKQSWWRVNRLMTPPGFRPWILWLGSVAALFLVVYTLALGLEGDAFQTQRRIGAVIFFSGTYLAQLVFTYQSGHLDLPRHNHHWQVTLCTAVLLLGLLTLVLDWCLGNYDDYEDAFEWVFAALLQMYFVMSYWTWRAMDLRLAGKNPLETAGLNRS